MSCFHYDKKEIVKTVMNTWSDDVYEKIPFTLSAKDAKMSDTDLECKMYAGMAKRWKPKNGFGWTFKEMVKETETTGYVTVVFYYGTGD